MSLLIRGAQLAGAGPVDIRMEGDRIAEVSAGLSRAPGEEVVEAAGGEVLPGLHDHHVHLRSWAAALASVPAGPPEIRDRAGLARALGAGAPGRWVRAVGYHESVAGLLDRWELDRLCGDRPVRLQHRSGALWILNSAALAEVRVDRAAPPGVERQPDGVPTGRIWREDGWLAARLPPTAPDLGAVGRAAAARGVSGFTDATPSGGSGDMALLEDAVRTGLLPQRVTAMTAPGVTVQGLTVQGVTVRGVTGPAGGPLAIGPVKLILDDTALPGLADFVAAIRDAHRAGRRVAVHCVTAAQAALTVAALDEAGAEPGDRLEHASLLDAGLVAAVRRLGLTVVTQPGFVHDRGDRYLRDVPVAEHPDLWRLGSLIRAGIEVAAGTDAPFGPSDPWRAISTAMDRATRDGAVLGPAERVPIRVATQMWTGSATHPARPRLVRPGAVADLCVLDRPLETASPATGRSEGTGSEGPGVRATIIGGRVVFRAPQSAPAAAPPAAPAATQPATPPVSSNSGNTDSRV